MILFIQQLTRTTRTSCFKMTVNVSRSTCRISFLFALLLLVSTCSSFAPSSSFSRQASLSASTFPSQPSWIVANQDNAIVPIRSSTKLCMAQDDEGPGLMTSIGIGFIILLFVATGLLPLMQGGGDRDLSISDSVVTRQDKPGKLEKFESKQDHLSRAMIQEKLSSIPVFYLSEGGTMKTDIYLSYVDAKEAAGAGVTIKATSLDQVMFPLVLKRGRMRMEPPPAEVAKAEADITFDKTYRLVPSKAAREQAAEFKVDLTDGDVPFFVADRLAFAGAKGPQLPLFTDKNDCIYSYQRLREGSKKLPEIPNIRVATLMDELFSMEKGTRPGVSQLAFYANAEDLSKATEIFQL